MLISSVRTRFASSVRSLQVVPLALAVLLGGGCDDPADAATDTGNGTGSDTAGGEDASAGDTGLEGDTPEDASEGDTREDVAEDAAGSDTLEGEDASEGDVEPDSDTSEGEDSVEDTGPYCGDGVVDDGEECDGEEHCSESCTWLPYCGDGLIDEEEWCEDGNAENGDGCSSTCQEEAGWRCLGLPSVCESMDILLEDNWIHVSAGTFMMGGIPDTSGAGADEDYHEVTLTRDFEIARYTVTQGQWRSLMGNNPSCFQNWDARGCSTVDENPHAPVENVNWYNAVTFANALSVQAGFHNCYEISECEGTEGVDGGYICDVALAGGNAYDCEGYRLPTEAEWEYAARAGSVESRHGDTKDIAWHSGNAHLYPHPVGLLEPNDWGLYDMLGNVHELVWDWYTESLGTEPVTDPEGAESGTHRMRRGGYWAVTAHQVRAHRRWKVLPSEYEDSTGFRLVRTLP